MGKPRRLENDFWEDWEDALVGVDLGIKLTQSLLTEVKNEVKREQINDPAEIRRRVEEKLLHLLGSADSRSFQYDNYPVVIVVMGVNGTGKTTTIAKLAHKFQNDGKRVLLVAADTHRAAAIEQLEVWARRLKTEVIKQNYGGDPAAVAYDALRAARSRGYDYLLVDTAGRFHTRSDLMGELHKIIRVLGKIQPDVPHEVILVLDASVGQNGLVQAQKFAEVLPLTGIIITKIDGTGRGGIVVAIQKELQLPVLALGVGEGLNDLVDFEPRAFARALLED